MAAGLGFMVLDTVDGKLARCTITSSKWGNVFDHGIDLVHPPFWWWAWAVGLAAYGTPISTATFWWLMVVIQGGYLRPAPDRGHLHAPVRDAHPRLAQVRFGFPADHRAAQSEHGDPVRRA